MRGTFEEPPTGLIPWFSKVEGNTYATFLHHPFLFGEIQRSAQEVARRISSAVAAEVRASQDLTSNNEPFLASMQNSSYQVPITNSSPSRLHYLPFASRFPLPHFTLAILFALSFPIFSSLFFACLFLFARVLDCLPCRYG